MKNKTTLELAFMLNEINKQMNELEIEYNKVVNELWERIPKLKDDVNMQKVKTKGDKNGR